MLRCVYSSTKTKLQRKNKTQISSSHDDCRVLALSASMPDALCAVCDHRIRQLQARKSVHDVGLSKVTMLLANVGRAAQDRVHMAAQDRYN
jgi:hypothetical protein